MFHSEGMEHRLNRIHEKALRRIYSSDSPLNVTELLTQDKSFTIHKKLQSFCVRRRPSAFIINFKTYFTPCSSVSIVNFY